MCIARFFPARRLRLGLSFALLLIASRLGTRGPT